MDHTVAALDKDLLHRSTLGAAPPARPHPTGANEPAHRSEQPLVGQACVIGDGRPYIAVLLVPDLDGVRARAAERAAPEPSLPEAAADGDLRAEIAAHIDLVNQRFARPEQVRAFELLGEEWSPDTDVMTPTGKLKRPGIADRYSGIIDRLYETPS